MTWYLKKRDGGVFGPVELAALQTWASDGRVAPDDKVSEDPEHWLDAPDLPDLSMIWMVELQGGTKYGPVHLLALRDLLQDNSINGKTRLTNRQTGEVTTVADALLPAMIGQAARLQSTVDALTARMHEVEGQGAAPLDKNEAASAEALAKLRKEFEAAVAAKTRLQEEGEKWKKLYEEQWALAQRKDGELKKRAEAAAPAGGAAKADPGEVAKLKAALEKERAAAREQAERAKAAADQVSELQMQADKWKKLYEHQREVVQTEKAKAKPAPPPAEGDMVPRALLEESTRKLAQVERSYQQLLRGVSRGAGQRGAVPSQPPDILRRRDMS